MIAIIIIEVKTGIDVCLRDKVSTRDNNINNIYIVNAQLTSCCDESQLDNLFISLVAM